MMTKTIKYKQLRREPWLTTGLLKSINKDKKLYRLSIRSQALTTDIIKYKNYHQILGKVKRQTKRQYYIDQCKKFKNNTKKLWQTINKVIGQTNDKSTIIDRLQIDNKPCYDPAKISNKLSKYFSSVGKNFAEKIPKPTNSISYYLNKIEKNPKSLFLSLTTTVEIDKYISNLPNKTSSGHDAINNVLLKQIKASILVPLTDIFNTSLKNGTFPNLMKLAEVIPLHKGKAKDNEANYRPISLLLTISKILEKVMYNKIYDFLTITNQIYQSQYGFRRRHFCEHAIGELVGEVIKNLENMKFTATIYLDLSKAFDTLEHSTLLSKLEIYGV